MPPARVSSHTCSMCCSRAATRPLTTAGLFLLNTDAARLSPNEREIFTLRIRLPPSPLYGVYLSLSVFSWRALSMRRAFHSRSVLKRMFSLTDARKMSFVVLPIFTSDYFKAMPATPTTTMSQTAPGLLYVYSQQCTPGVITRSNKLSECDRSLVV
ncbi:unnamed protein product [Danaus chrysippus]|uniref:(African queen) hypothetical protein n=1 Tax=Danaus chrysippus TaxID=151541 RepID=A0A8J2VW27_9NEOP|nr:unnamed protein product [Danaus chrysippus]